MIQRFVLAILTVGVLSFALLPATLVFAQDPACAAGGTLAQTEYCQQQSDQNDTPGNNPVVGPDGILNKVVEIVTLITAIASVIVVIIGGIMYTVSAGDPGRASQARNAIIYALVGLVVSLVTRQIVLFVLDRVGSDT